MTKHLIREYLNNGTTRIPIFTEVCDHSPAVRVTALGGTTVAWLCPDCDTQLPAAWTFQEDDR